VEEQFLAYLFTHNCYQSTLVNFPKVSRCTVDILSQILLAPIIDVGKTSSVLKNLNSL